MKRTIISTLFALALVITYTGSVNAQMGMMGFDSENESQAELDTHSEEIDEVLENVLSAHGVSIISELNCDEVTNDEFERLGDAWMGVMHPDPELHERMDRMMGGEGSESLDNAHIVMGSRFLGCGNDSEGTYRGMFASHMSNGNSSGKRPWMIGGNTKATKFNHGMYGLGGIITWILLVMFLTTGSIYFLKGIAGKKRN